MSVKKLMSIFQKKKQKDFIASLLPFYNQKPGARVIEQKVENDEYDALRNRSTSFSRDYVVSTVYETTNRYYFRTERYNTRRTIPFK